MPLTVMQTVILKNEGKRSLVTVASNPKESYRAVFTIAQNWGPEYIWSVTSGTQGEANFQEWSLKTKAGPNTIASVDHFGCERPIQRGRWNSSPSKREQSIWPFFTVGHIPLVASIANADCPEPPERHDKPIVKCFKANNGKAWGDHNGTFQLLIDLKTEVIPTLQLLVEQFKKYPAVFDPSVNKNAIHVVTTGNRPVQADFNKYPSFIFPDGNFNVKYDALREFFVHFMSLKVRRVTQRVKLYLSI